MLKSLYAGVSGLQSHQIAMDVESNNVANVNTVGFKYARANFSDLLAQTTSIATAPEGSIGGKNAVQVGLGSTVSSMTRIFSQGSIQSTDKNTDIAIQGDGFFIVSPDSGTTYKFTRAGDFKFDAGGNFVDNNGFIAQGWMRDSVTGVVDTTAPIANIKIAPGLTTPAFATTAVALKANLNSGPVVENYSPAYAVQSYPIATAVPNPPAIDANGTPVASGNMGVLFNELGESFALQTNQGIWASFSSSTVTGAAAPAAGVAELDITFTLDDGTTRNIVTTGALATNTAAANANRYVAAINAQTSVTGVTASYDTITGRIVLVNDNSSSSASHNINFTQANDNSGLGLAGVSHTAYKYQYSPTASAKIAGVDKTFTTLADLREAMEIQARTDGGAGLTNGIAISVTNAGKIQITNTGTGVEDYDVNLKITAISGGGISANTRFTTSMVAMSSFIPAGSSGIAYSQSINAAAHSSSIDVFDSLGSKHTLRMEFRKVAVDPVTSTWAIKLSVPEPGTINTLAPLNEKTGSIKFNNDGSLSSIDPQNIFFSGNNGSTPNQLIDLKLGTPGAFDGMTSFDSESSTSGISQDGYTGGDLIGIRINQSGVLVGSFSNGRSFGLAQIGMAKFTNNEGLATEGGNVYIQTANSGDPIIGTAATSGRGFIQSASLEASNVDLSRALTQLIIIQRGYQANGKTITTSDQLLQTLIGLKQ